MTKRDLLVAALVWDVPSLVRSESETAKIFLDSLSPAPRLEPEHGDEPLNLAAAAIRAARTGETETVTPPIRSLRRSRDPVSKALGLCLEWWLVGTGSTTRSVADATSIVRNLRGRSLRARVLAKLATYSLDHHEYDISAALLQEARKTASPGTELRRGIAIALNNEFGVRPTQADFEFGTADDLTHYTWIDATALGAAQADFEQRLSDSARNPWSFTIRAGQTPLDAIIAAELQATWAGALWKRRNLRKQVGAQMLLGGARNAGQALYGVARWVEGGGRDIPQVVEQAERVFDGNTADSLVAEVLGPPDRPVRSQSQVELAANLWDLVSDSTVEELLRRVTVDPTELGAPSRFLWSRAAVRIPRTWSTAVRGLTTRQRVALAAHLPGEALQNLSRRDAKTIAAEIDADDQAPERSRAVAIILKSRVARKPLDLSVAPSLALDVAGREPTALSASAYHDAELALVDVLTRTLERARQGTFDMGTFSIPLAIATLAEARGHLDRTSLSVLTATARDPGAPGQVRVDALIGLTRKTRACWDAEEG